jgi:hypothetical protein
MIEEDLCRGLRHRLAAIHTAYEVLMFPCLQRRFLEKKRHRTVR